nr:polyphenol oxidase family protein [Psychromicrobium silvestre]
MPAGSAALQHRAALRSTLGLAQDFQFMTQVHGREVLTVESQGEQPTADGLVSTTLPLAVMVADCLPVLMLAEGDDSILTAAVHAGRQGVAKGILPHAVERLRQRGAERVEVWIGPSICGACYEVPEEMRAELATTIPEAFSETSWGTPALNLRAAATAQLRGIGVTVHQVEACTLEEPTLYSHRASQQQGRPEGRFAGLIFPMQKVGAA